MRNIVRYSAIVLLAAGTILGAAACSHGSAPAKQSGQRTEFTVQDQQLLQYELSQPNPFFHYSAYRNTLQSAETVQAEGLQGTAFFMTEGNPTYPIFTCPELGSPVPNTAQLTNPVQPFIQWVPGSYNEYGRYEALTVGNMDPNGIYAPNASSGTYVMCSTPNGKQLHYWEGPVYSVSGPAFWDWKLNQGHGGVKLLGPPTKIVIPPAKKVAASPAPTHS